MATGQHNEPCLWPMANELPLSISASHYWLAYVFVSLRKDKIYLLCQLDLWPFLA